MTGLTVWVLIYRRDTEEGLHEVPLRRDERVQAFDREERAKEELDYCPAPREGTNDATYYVKMMKLVPI
jgi:hypothetical protein